MKFKLVVSLVLVFLALVFITQNTATVRVAFLAWSLEMSLVLLLFFMLAAGLVLGLLLPGLLRFTDQTRKKKEERSR
jgi:uncharacterized integral membrane protein